MAWQHYHDHTAASSIILVGNPTSMAAAIQVLAFAVPLDSFIFSNSGVGTAELLAARLSVERYKSVEKFRFADAKIETLGWLFVGSKIYLYDSTA